MKKLAKNDEIDIQDRSKAREIVQVILDYGVNQSQIYHMIYLLSLELENVEDMKAITNLLNNLNKKTSDKKSGLITTGE